MAGMTQKELKKPFFYCGFKWANTSALTTVVSTFGQSIVMLEIRYFMFNQ